MQSSDQLFLYGLSLIKTEISVVDFFHLFENIHHGGQLPMILPEFRIKGLPKVLVVGLEFVEHPFRIIGWPERQRLEKSE